MELSVGTFNLNDLFSRFNFEGVVDELRRSDQPAGSLTIRYEFTDPGTYRIRTFRGRLVNAKDSEETSMIAGRINAIDLNVLAVQEVENIEVLKSFNQDHLGNRYRYRVLVEGNDPRFIDVGILSKLPVGAVTSF